jgi:hypothetical protein
MKIVSKKEAIDLADKLRKAKVKVTIEKFDNGKYRWTGKEKDYHCWETQDVDGVFAVFVERRVDTDGPYAQIMCCCKPLTK